METAMERWFLTTRITDGMKEIEMEKWKAHTLFIHQNNVKRVILTVDVKL